MEFLFRLIGFRRLLILARWVVTGSFPNPLAGALSPVLGSMLAVFGLGGLGTIAAGFVAFVFLPTLLLWYGAIAEWFGGPWTPLALAGLPLAVGLDGWLFWHNYRLWIRSHLFAEWAVEAEVRRSFAPEDEEAVLRLLEQVRTTHGTRDRAHTQLNLLYWSRGDKVELARLVAWENEDYRDRGPPPRPTLDWVLDLI